MTHPVIQYDYEFSPYAQKTRLLLTAAGVPYQQCAQPLVMPRPDLERLGITHRRIPLLAIGKDIYADTSLIADTILTKLGRVTQTVADKAFEAWSAAVFQSGVALIPVDLLNDAFVQDRAPVFPTLARKDFASLRPSGLAACRVWLTEAEERFLSGSSSAPFMSGDQLSLADIHVAWPLRWILTRLKVQDEPGFGPEAFPKVWRLINSLPETNPPVLSAEDSFKAITEGSYSATNVTFDSTDPIAKNIAEGGEVCVEANDAGEGTPHQNGKLIGISKEEIVLEVGQHGVRLHFPRIGYLVRGT